MDNYVGEAVDLGIEQTITEIERQILDFMVHYLRTNTYQPSIREIGERFSIKSTKTVSEHLQALADKGFLERDPSRSRGVKILGVDLSAQTVSVPCYHELPKDGGGLRTEQAEMHLTMDRRLAGAKGAFFVRAKADQFESADITEGDYLLIEPATVEELAEQAIVVARIGSKPSFYEFSRNGRGVQLTSVQAGAEATVVGNPDGVDIIGRLVALYRRLDDASILVSTTAH
jgi:repressor LexA